MSNINAEQFYLEWYNDFLTVERFAEYHGISSETAMALIEQGKNDHKYRRENNETI